MEIRPARREDVAAWLEPAREVEASAPETAEGEAAWRLFLSLGFEGQGPRGADPSGSPTWRMERSAGPPEMEEQE